MKAATATTFDVSEVVRATRPCPRSPTSRRSRPCSRRTPRRSRRTGGRGTRSPCPERHPARRSLHPLPRKPSGRVRSTRRRHRPPGLHGPPPARLLPRHDLADDLPGGRQPRQRPRRGIAAAAGPPSGPAPDRRAAGGLREGVGREPLARGLRRVLCEGAGARRPGDRPVPAGFLDHRAGGAGRCGGRPAGRHAVLLRIHLPPLCGIPEVTLEGTPRTGRSLAEGPRASPSSAWGGGSRRWGRSSGSSSGPRGGRGGVVLAIALQAQRSERRPGGHGLDHGLLPLFEAPRTGQATVPVGGSSARGGSRRSGMLYPSERPLPGFARGPTIESLPGGLSKAPFRWEYLGRPLRWSSWEASWAWPRTGRRWPCGRRSDGRCVRPRPGAEDRDGHGRRATLDSDPFTGACP